MKTKEKKKSIVTSSPPSDSFARDRKAKNGNFRLLQLATTAQSTTHANKKKSVFSHMRDVAKHVPPFTDAPASCQTPSEVATVHHSAELRSPLALVPHFERDRNEGNTRPTLITSLLHQTVSSRLLAENSRGSSISAASFLRLTDRQRTTHILSYLIQGFSLGYRALYCAPCML